MLELKIYENEEELIGNIFGNIPRELSNGNPISEGMIDITLSNINQLVLGYRSLDTPNTDIDENLISLLRKFYENQIFTVARHTPVIRAILDSVESKNINALKHYLSDVRNYNMVIGTEDHLANYLKGKSSPDVPEIDEMIHVSNIHKLLIHSIKGPQTSDDIGSLLHHTENLDRVFKEIEDEANAIYYDTIEEWANFEKVVQNLEVPQEISMDNNRLEEISKSKEENYAV